MLAPRSTSDGRTRVALTIAGSDSGGGAGIQADLKAFAAAGVHGATAVTALTAQNTVGVTLIEAVSPEMIVAQVEAVAADMGVDAVKIGMLGSTASIETVARALALLGPDAPVVHNPVTISESGARLLPEDALAALLELIVPRATVITPNRGGTVPEAAAAARSAAPEAVLRGLRDVGAGAGPVDILQIDRRRTAPARTPHPH